MPRQEARGCGLRLDGARNDLARPSILRRPPEELMWQAYQEVSELATNGPAFTRPAPP